MFCGLHLVFAVCKPDICAASFEIFQYEVVNGGITITGCEEFVVGDVNIPAVIADLNVTTIGDHSFSARGEIAKITLPETVTKIGVAAFAECSSLKEILLPEGLIGIDNYAFAGCSELSGCKIPETVTEIGVAAFAECPSLKEISLPEMLQEISDYTFSGCSGLTQVDIPSNVQTLGLASFSDCIGLEDVNMPSGLVSIDDYAFAGCEMLEEILIPKSVAVIGRGIFDRSFNLKATNVDQDSVFFESVDGVLFDFGMRTIIHYPDRKPESSYFVPPTVKRIEEYAFSGCGSLTSIFIPKSVSEIGRKAFAFCYGLESITIPDSVNYIGDDAFEDTGSLDSVVISKLWHIRSDAQRIGLGALWPVGFVDSQDSPQSAKASAVLVDGFVVKVDVNNSGGKYTGIPKVEIKGGGGRGARAEAFVEYGRVVDVKVTNAGFGYVDIPDVVIEAPSALPSIDKIELTNITTRISNHATAIPVLHNGFLTSVTITNSGDHYFVVPNVTIVDRGRGSGALVEAVIANGKVASIRVLDAGIEYSDNTEIIISPPDGGPASYLIEETYPVLHIGGEPELWTKILVSDQPSGPYFLYKVMEIPANGLAELVVDFGYEQMFFVVEN